MSFNPLQTKRNGFKLFRSAYDEFKFNTDIMMREKKQKSSINDQLSDN